MRHRNIRILLGFLIAIMPTNTIRSFLYRLVFGYRIYRSHIGWMTIIVVYSAELNECKIGWKNQFVGPMTVVINKDVRIEHNNVFHCGWWSQEDQFKAKEYGRSLKVGEKTLITSEHHFDVVGSLVIGKDSWIGGCGSQFWTHGAGVLDRDISIGDHCYIGSAVRFAPGSSVGNNCIVGLGSVVTKAFDEENVIIAGQPAKIVRKNYDWETQQSI